MSTMTKTSTKIVGVAASAAMVLGATAAAATAVPATAAADENQGMAAVDQNAATAQSDAVAVDAVIGQFSYSQGQTSPAEFIAKVFKAISAVACNPGTMNETEASGQMVDDARDWKFSVSGSVQNGFTATVGAFVGDNEGSDTTVMGCACAGNPADGIAVVNAEISGVKLQDIIMKAAPTADANAVKLVSADGYSQVVPLWYLYTNKCLIAYEIAGEPVSETMGGTVQVWIDGASANYYVSDVETIEVLALDETPAAPSEAMNFANSPNVTVLEAS